MLLEKYVLVVGGVGHNKDQSSNGMEVLCIEPEGSTHLPHLTPYRFPKSLLSGQAGILNRSKSTYRKCLPIN